MALYDISQITITEGECNAKQSLLDKKSCIDELLIQLREVEKTNVDALNADATQSGSYAILAQFQANYKVQPIQKWLDLINTTKNEIAIREKRMNDARDLISRLTARTSSITANPSYQVELATKEKNDKIKRNVTIGVVVIVVVILIVYFYKRSKKKTEK